MIKKHTFEVGSELFRLSQSKLYRTLTFESMRSFLAKVKKKVGKLKMPLARHYRSYC